MTHQWSPQQESALAEAGRWFRSYRAGSGAPQIFRLFGYAGTGKTTLAKTLAQDAGQAVYAAFTGKAALMMKRNGCEGASTIHSLIYTAVEEPDGSFSFVWNPDSPAAEADLIVIDECSMVGEDIGRDLMRFGKPILVLGDPAQLPPVDGAGFFTEATPDVMLTEIHRQARDNPIIQLATAARMGQRLEDGDYGRSRVVQQGVLSGREVLAADQVLVGRNFTRQTYNTRIRRLLGARGDLPVHSASQEVLSFPQERDRLICLRNDKTKGIFNGGMFRLLANPLVRGKYLTMLVRSDDFPDRADFEVTVHCGFFDGSDVTKIDRDELRGTQQFDFAYAITCHKSQGSQWPNVVIFDESAVFRQDWQRWLYTAITRASESVTVVKMGGAR